jgi:tRNA dimethylallyltransferase
VATLAIVGPTASGKSEVAVRVARNIAAEGRAAEIVAVDAFTVYRGMDIATAKPSPADRAVVPHHMVDILDPSEELTVADFQARAREAIERVRDRGATPLLVGGSGLYWRAVVDDLRFPPTDPAVRERLERRWGNDAGGAHAHLAGQDPAAADRIGPANLRRTVRALEVIELTGERFSDFDGSWDRFESRYHDLEVAYLEPDAEELRSRIEARARRMVDAGLLEEVAVLRAGPQDLSRTAMQAIGYAEAIDVLDGRLAPHLLAVTIARRTWRYAKRQRGWFRADPRCVPTAPDVAVERLTSAVDTARG